MCTVDPKESPVAYTPPHAKADAGSARARRQTTTKRFTEGPYVGAQSSDSLKDDVKRSLRRMWRRREVRCARDPRRAPRDLRFDRRDGRPHRPGARGAV